MFEEAKYFAKQTARWATLKGVINTGTRLLASAVGRTSVWWAGTVIALGAASSAVLSHFDYRHQMGRIGRFYNEEIGAMLGIDAEHVDITDVKRVAYGDVGRNLHANPTIHQEVALAKRHRWLKIGVSVLASALAVAAVIYLAPLIFTATFLASGAAPLALAGMGAVAGFISGQTLGTVGEYAIGLHKHRPHTVINDIRHHRRGNNRISPEQVMEVLAAAKPGLDETIRHEFGQKYHKLSPGRQTEVVKRYGETFNVEQLTRDLNNRQIRVTELAFIAYNQHSGVQRLPEPPMTATERATLMTRITLQKGRDEAQRVYENGKEMAGQFIDGSRERAGQALHYGAEKLSAVTGKARQLFAREREQEDRPVFLQEILDNAPQQNERSFTEKAELSKINPALTR